MNPIKYISKKIKRERIKDDQRVPLVLYHTFPSGDKLYTYEKEHYGLIASRYWKFINKSMNDLLVYGQAVHTISASNKKEKELFTEITQNAHDPAKVTELAMKGYSTCEFRESFFDNKVAIEMEQLKLIFCMFHLLNDEPQGACDDTINARKLELINAQDPVTQGFFFQRAKSISDDLGFLLETDIPDRIKTFTKILEKRLSTPEILKETGSILKAE